MDWHKGDINGVTITDLKKHSDKRGFLVETFRADELPHEILPQMSYVSYTEPGMERGPHEHVFQTDIFSFIGPGNFLIKLWDNRTISKTYGSYMEIYGGSEIPISIVVPPGIVHGYKNVSMESGMVINYPNKLYRGFYKKEDVDEIRHEDLNNSPFKLG